MNENIDFDGLLNFLSSDSASFDPNIDVVDYLSNYISMDQDDLFELIRMKDNLYNWIAYLMFKARNVKYGQIKRSRRYNK